MGMQMVAVCITSEGICDLIIASRCQEKKPEDQEKSTQKFVWSHWHPVLVCWLQGCSLLKCEQVYSSDIVDYDNVLVGTIPSSSACT